ncbi:chloroquine resistance protein [Francisella sp. LA112445]|uniref:chloroquine resistance protein n=1 Tax=Francisella sp. LA112445 TaxID=1395624 RepID=UPI001788D85B|nr:chloroquine resistance protein [Francisella sp. LA112445]QIW10272.1 chloroquine resistance protein [Francisella sp. LA112445]
MSFENQLSDIFDLDIWELKPQYKSSNQLQTDFESSAINLEESMTNPKEEVDTSRELIYTNNVDNNKIINIFIQSDLNIQFLNNVVDSLFYNSKVSIFKVQSTDIQLDSNEVNLFEEEFILDKGDLLSIQNKKHILSKLYEYADFKSR